MTVSATDIASPTLAYVLFEPFRNAGRLYAHHWVSLILIAAVGSTASDLLMFAAVELGLRNALLGMTALSLVVLTKLIVIVVTLQMLRGDLPNVRKLAASRAADEGRPERNVSFSLVAVALLPFFAYYAAWGFLSDTVREYSREALSKAPFGEQSHFLDLMQSRWLIASIVLCWLIRFVVKRINAARPAPLWPYVIVACDATWVFIGLYGITVWQDEFMRWLVSGAWLSALVDGIAVGQAFAAEAFTPKEMTPEGWIAGAQRLFFYALLPLVWFVIVAIVYGYDVAGKSSAAAQPVPNWRKWLGDFANHFIGSMISRYRPVVRSIGLALGAGLPTLCVLVVGYRLIDYAGAWIWIAAGALIGERPLPEWQLLAVPINLLFGSLTDQNGGILLNPLRLCLLAAIFEQTVAAATAKGSHQGLSNVR